MSFRLLEGHIRHPETALPLYLDETVGAEPVQGLAQGGGTHFVGSFEELDTQFVPGPEFAVNDVFSQALVGLVRQRFCFHLHCSCRVAVQNIEISLIHGYLRLARFMCTSKKFLYYFEIKIILYKTKNIDKKL